MFCPNIFLTCCGFISVTRPIMLQSHNFWLQSGIRQSSFHDSHNSLEKVDKEKRSGKVAMKSERAKQCWIFALSMNSEQFNPSYIKEQMTDVLTSLSLWSIITIFLSVGSPSTRRPECRGETNIVVKWKIQIDILKASHTLGCVIMRPGF